MKTKQFFTGLLCLVVCISSCKKDGQVAGDNNPEQAQAGIYTVAQINQEIKSNLQRKGSFDWTDLSDEMLFSAAIHGDSLLTIGYGETGSNLKTEQTGADLASVSKEDAIKSGINIEGIKQNLLDLVRTSEGIQKNRPATESSNDGLVKSESPKLNYVTIKISKLNTIQQLRKSGQVRYLDPSNYNRFLIKQQPKERSTDFMAYQTGNGVSTESFSLPTELDPNLFTTVAPGAIIPKIYYDQKIPEAWEFGSGRGITVAVIDEGVFSTQAGFGSQFNSGLSSGRTIGYRSTFNNEGVYAKDSDFPEGHGNKMSSLIAAPRVANMPLGIAYNCNLLAYRGTDNVLLFGSKQQEGVAKALTELADNKDVKIISMSLGWIWKIGVISDAVKYAYGKGKLMFAAAGTTLSSGTIDLPDWIGVTFPATMPETVAATGTNYSTNGTLVKCGECHEGPEVMFTTTTANAPDQNKVLLTLGKTTGTQSTTGSSSASTAINASIAAVVWSVHPSWNRDQVLQKMKESARFYPNRNNKLGYGPVNVLKAVQ